MYVDPGDEQWGDLNTSGASKSAPPAPCISLRPFSLLDRAALLTKRKAIVEDIASELDLPVGQADNLARILEYDSGKLQKFLANEEFRQSLRQQSKQLLRAPVQPSPGLKAKCGHNGLGICDDEGDAEGKLPLEEV